MDERHDLADGQLADFISGFLAMDPPSAAEAGAEALRAGTEERAASRPKGPDLHRVADLDVPGPAGAPDVPARLYRPTAEPTPIVLYLHGGGYVMGDVETHDRALRRFAATSGLAVLSLDYRRAPEHPYPAALDDTVAALRWLATRPAVVGAITDVAVGGDSAGGNLSALACIRLRDEGSDALPVLQVLVYAQTDLLVDPTDGSSAQTKATGYATDTADVLWFVEQWVPDPELRADPALSPRRVADLSGLPEAIVLTVEHDPIRDQAEDYARRLVEAGVRVTARREPGLVHNFLLWDLFSPACAAAADRLARDVRAALVPA